MRLVTSLTLVQNQLKNVFLISIVVVITILALRCVRPVFRAEHRGAAGAGGAHRRQYRAGGSWTFVCP